MKGLKGWTAALFAFLLAVALPASAAAAPGDFDTTFSGDGKVITNVTSGFDYSSGLVVQLDGRIITAGLASGGGGRFYLVRYLSDGNLDTSFGDGDGVVFTNFTPGADFGYDVIFDNSSRIVVVGGVGGSGGRFGVARYTLDGTPDTDFGGGDGKVVTNFTPGNDFAYNALLQDLGKIVVVGRAGGSGGRFALARYNDDGSLDTSFGDDGKVMTNFTAGDDYIDDVANAGLGSVVVAGTANLGRDSRFALAQYDSTGELDVGFGGDGKVTTNLTRGLDGAWGIANQGAGRYAVTGPAGGRVGLLRYTSGGELDESFGGGDGITRTDWSSGLDWSDEITSDADGRIVIVGISNAFGNDPRYAIARYSFDGAHDFTKITNLTGGVDYGLDVQVHPATQNIVTTGAVRNGRQSFVARHLSN